jgi:transposase
VASLNGRLKLFFLPGYSPELNPDEWVWKNVKHDQVGPPVLAASLNCSGLSPAPWNAYSSSQTSFAGSSATPPFLHQNVTEVR